MNLASRFSVVALLLFGLTAQAKTDAALLEAIAHVETGMDRKAIGKAGERGAYQMKASAWADANIQLTLEGRPTYSWSKWRDATAQDVMALAYLRCLRKRLKALGIPDPSPAQLALVWNRGLSGAMNRGWQPNDYADRVSNIFNSQTTPVR
jgi:hypothetical protein